MSDIANFAQTITPLNSMNNGQMAQHGNDSSLAVVFYKESIWLEAASDEAGHPIFKDFDYIHVVMPGGKSEMRRPVKLFGENGQGSDPERWPAQWTAFQNQNTEARIGLPLEQCPFMPKAEIMGFKAGGIMTVEQLAGIPDSALQNFGMTGRKWRDMAITYLERAAGNKDISALVTEHDTLKRDFELLKQQFVSLSGGVHPVLPQHEPAAKFVAPAAPKQRKPRGEKVALAPVSPAAIIATEPKKRGRKPTPKPE